MHINWTGKITKNSPKYTLGIMSEFCECKIGIKKWLNSLKSKLKTNNHIYDSIKKNKVLWNKLNCSGKIPIHWKTTENYWKKFLKVCIIVKISHIHGLGGLIVRISELPSDL
jgi:hypothetical protein